MLFSTVQYLMECMMLSLSLLACRAFSIVLFPVDRNSNPFLFLFFQVHSRGLDDFVREVIAFFFFFLLLYLEVLLCM